MKASEAQEKLKRLW